MSQKSILILRLIKARRIWPGKYRRRILPAQTSQGNDRFSRVKVFRTPTSYYNHVGGSRFFCPRLAVFGLLQRWFAGSAGRDPVGRQSPNIFFNCSRAAVSREWPAAFGSQVRRANSKYSQKMPLCFFNTGSARPL